MNLVDKKRWEEIFPSLENPHILQTFEWGELKSHFGWVPFRFDHQGFPFQILLRELPLGLKIAYIPKCKVELSDSHLWKLIDQFCLSNNVIFLKIEPDFITEKKELEPPLDKSFLVGKSIQPKRTIEIDLSGSESDWLDRMKSKTRYNIRLAMKKGVTVEISDDISTFYELILETSRRDKFGVHSKKYYQLAYDLFKKKNNVGLLIAKYQGEPLAGLMVFQSGNRAWYFYGASNNNERNRMPTYLIQFEAMKWAKSMGCNTYDLWGIPDEDEENLEQNFESRSDGLWGVYRFKRGFGGVIQESHPAYDRVYKSVLYKLFNLAQKIRSDTI